MAARPPATEKVSTARPTAAADRKSTRLNSSHSQISNAAFCLKKKTELESAAVAHPAVAEAAAVGVPHEVKGEAAWIFRALVPRQQPVDELSEEPRAYAAREVAGREDRGGWVDEVGERDVWVANGGRKLREQHAWATEPGEWWNVCGVNVSGVYVSLRAFFFFLMERGPAEISPLPLRAAFPI